MTAAFLSPERAHASTTLLTPRTWRQLLTTRLAQLSGDDIGRICKCDHTTASRIASDQRGALFTQWCDLIDAMGFKLVSKEKVCVSADRLRFLEQTTARALANEQVAATLWDEEAE